MVRHLFSSLLLLGLAVAGPASANCGRLLVSGYQSSVHVYDACSGAFTGLLGPQGQLQGPQSVRLHQDMLYVVAEGRGEVLRFDADTLAFVDTFIMMSPADGITGVAFGPDGDVYVGAYNRHVVYRFDGATGAPKGPIFEPRAAGLAGPDNGLVFGPDGRLYIPGYDSHSIVRWDPASGSTEAFVATGSGGLLRTRGILFEPDGQALLVSSEGSGQVLRYRADGSFDRVLASLPAVDRPTGIDFGAEGELLVTSDIGNRVQRLGAADGSVLGELVAKGSGGLSRATFLLHLKSASEPGTVDQAQVGSQYWITGAGTLTGNTLQLDDMQSATGTGFGSAFDADAVVRKRWGSISVTFDGCDAARLQWDSTGADSAGFGSDGYTLQRVAPTRDSEQCHAVGFGNTGTADWLAGTWFGGAERSGEGLFLDVLSNGVVVAAFFTHRPPAQD